MQKSPTKETIFCSRRYTNDTQPLRRQLLWMYTICVYIRRLLKIIGLFCKRALQRRRYSAKETYNFTPTTHMYVQYMCVEALHKHVISSYSTGSAMRHSHYTDNPYVCTTTTKTADTQSQHRVCQWYTATTQTTHVYVRYMYVQPLRRQPSCMHNRYVDKWSTATAQDAPIIHSHCTHTTYFYADTTSTRDQQPQHRKHSNCAATAQTAVICVQTLRRQQMRGGGLGSSTIFKNLMSPTPRRKWYLTTRRRAH